MGRACSQHGRLGFWCANQNEIDDLDVGGTIKTALREIGWGGTDWIYLAQDMDQWLALVNTVTNLRFP